ncbi:copper amine oxidase N-terminal domain-containing protein [Bacillus tianshenii]|nr:copper amine oxidase N-terminal domain-containing protein [Bacillus tianshenii]
MKRIVLLLLSCLSLLLVPTMSSAALKINPPIYVFVDGKEPNFVNQPYVKNGTTMVEFRPIFEMLGLTIDWNAKQGKITGKNSNKIIQLFLNQRNAYINNNKQILTNAPVLKNGKTMIPLRFVAEATGKKVFWDEKTQMIIINDGKFAKADFSFSLDDLNEQFLKDAENGFLGPFHASLTANSLGQVVNTYGFPEYRHNGSYASEDIPGLKYGHYWIFFLGEKGNTYLLQPKITEIAVSLPNKTTNAHITNRIGSPHEIDEGLYTNLRYYTGPYTLTVLSANSNLDGNAWWLKIN